MGLEIILAAVVGAALVGVVIHFWPALMGWSRDHLLPWVDNHLPWLSDIARTALQNLDNAVVTARRVISDAWRRLRTVVLSHVARFIERRASAWVVQITSYLHKQADPQKPYVRVVTEQELSYYDLPDDVRRAALANGLTNTSIDITAVRDQQVMEIAA